MSKKLRTLKDKLATKTTEAQAFLEEDNKDLEKAKKLLDECDDIQKEIDATERLEKMTGAQAQEAVADAVQAEEKETKEKSFSVIKKVLTKKALTDTEKALITGEDAEDGENYLIPEDIKLEINEYRKTYATARDIVTVEETASLTGSVNYETGTPAGLTAFDDGDEIDEEDNPSFTRKTFAIKFFGKLIPVSNILQIAERAGFMPYLNRWFLRNAIITENSKIFAVLKAGYNSGTPKEVAGWEALKRSINVDLDPSVKLTGMITTNQSGFADLDEEKDANGRPILQPNPANPTEKLFQGWQIKVFPDAQLPDNDDGSHPIIYGDTKAGATMKVFQDLQFAVSEHIFFNKNQSCIRVIEGFDVMSTDTTAYIYGSFTATPAPADDGGSGENDPEGSGGGGGGVG